VEVSIGWPYISNIHNPFLKNGPDPKTVFITVSYKMPADRQASVVAILNDGSEAIGRIAQITDGHVQQITANFRKSFGARPEDMVTMKDIKEFRFQWRPLQFAQFKNVALRPAATTHPSAATAPATQSADKEEPYRQLYARYKETILAAVRAGDADEVAKLTAKFNEAIGRTLLYVFVRNLKPGEKDKREVLLDTWYTSKKFKMPAIKYADMGRPHVSFEDGYVLINPGHLPGGRYEDDVYITMAIEPAAESTQPTTSPAEAGRLKAAADIRAGKARILYYGKPMGGPLVDDASGPPVEIAAGCGVTADFVAQTDAYNAAMRQWAKEHPATAPASAPATQPAANFDEEHDAARKQNPSGVAMEMSVPKTTYHVGETIPATLIFRNMSTRTYQVWDGKYDRSGRISDVSFALDGPAGGWTDPLRDYFRRTGGILGGGLGQYVKLGTHG